MYYFGTLYRKVAEIFKNMLIFFIGEVFTLIIRGGFFVGQGDLWMRYTTKGLSQKNTIVEKSSGVGREQVLLAIPPPED